MQGTESLTSPSVLQQCSSASLSLFNIPWRVFFLTVNKNTDWTSHQTYKPVPALLVMHSCSQQTHPDSWIWTSEGWIISEHERCCCLHNPLQLKYLQFLCSSLSCWVIWRISWSEIVETWHLIFYFYPSVSKTFLFNICNFYYDITL